MRRPPGQGASRLARGGVLDLNVFSSRAVTRISDLSLTGETVTVPKKVMELLAEWRGQCKFTGPDDFAFSIRTNSPIDLNRVLERTVKPLADRIGRYVWPEEAGTAA